MRVSAPPQQFKEFKASYNPDMGEINRGGLPDLDFSKSRGGLPDLDPTQFLSRYYPPRDISPIAELQSKEIFALGKHNLEL